MIKMIMEMMINSSVIIIIINSIIFCLYPSTKVYNVEQTCTYAPCVIAVEVVSGGAPGCTGIALCNTVTVVPALVPKGQCARIAIATTNTYMGKY